MLIILGTKEHALKICILVLFHLGRLSPLVTSFLSSASCTENSLKYKLSEELILAMKEKSLIG